MILSFSDTNKQPIRDYYFTDGKVSKINGVALTIYSFENCYITYFKYKNYNIDIETSNITLEELTALLKSIIK